MSGCTAFDAAIALHAAGGLDGPAREALEAHLAACPGCAAEFEETRALLGELAAARPALPPDREAAFAARVRAAAGPLSPGESPRPAAAPRPALTPGESPRPTARRLPLRLAAAAGALAAAAALALAFRPAAPPPRPAPTAGAPAGAADPAAALAADLATLAGDDFDPIPEADAGLGELSSDELLAMDRLLAGTGG
jgi:anti-sigma factor RsiW